QFGPFGKAHVDDFDTVATVGGVTNGRADQRQDLGDLVGGAGRVGHVAAAVIGIGAIDRHRHRQALELAGFDHIGLDGLGNLVIDDFFARDALFAGTTGTIVLAGAGQFVGNRHLAIGAVGEILVL